MSDTIALQATGINPLPYEAQANQLALLQQQQSQAQQAAALTHEQAVGADIQNRLAALRVGAVGGALGQMGWGGGAGAPGAPGAPSAMPADVGPPPLSALGGPAPPAAAPSELSQTLPAAGPALPPPVSPYGAVRSPFGVAVPGYAAAMAITSSDPTKAWEGVVRTRASTLAQMVGGATDLPSWNGAVMQAYTSGWLSPDDVHHLYGHPELYQTVMNSLADPDAHMSLLGTLAGKGLAPSPVTGQAVGSPDAQAGLAATAGAVKTAEAPGTAEAAILTKKGVAPINIAEKDLAPQKVPGGIVIPAVPKSLQLPGVQYPESAAPANTTVGNMMNPNRVMSASDWMHTSATFETGSEPKAAATNPQSMSDPTWLEAMHGYIAHARATGQTLPDGLLNLNDSGLLQLRANPDWANAVTGYYVRSNAPVLQRAGVPFDATTAKMMTFIGPAGTAAVMGAKPNTPLTQLLSPAAIQENPWLRGLTNSQFAGRMYSVFTAGQVPGVTVPADWQPPGQAQAGAGNGQGTAPGTQPAPTTSGAGAPATGQGTAPPPPAPGAASGVTTPSQWNPQPLPPGVQVDNGQTFTPTVTKDAAGNTIIGAGINPNTEDLQKMREEAAAESQSANLQNQSIEDAVASLSRITPGTWSSEKAGFQATVNSMVNNINAAAGHQIINPAFANNLGDYQNATKVLSQMLRQAVKETSPRAAVQEFPLIQKGLISTDTSPTGIRMIGAQLLGMNDYTMARNQFLATHAGPTALLQSTFEKRYPAYSFVLHRMATQDATALYNTITGGKPGTPQFASGIQEWNRMMNGARQAQADGLWPHGVVTMDNFPSLSGNQ
jgi:hypothetical protein